MKRFVEGEDRRQATLLRACTRRLHAIHSCVLCGSGGLSRVSTLGGWFRRSNARGRLASGDCLDVICRNSGRGGCRCHPRPPSSDPRWSAVCAALPRCPATGHRIANHRTATLAPGNELCPYWVKHRPAFHTLDSYSCSPCSPTCHCFDLNPDRGVWPVRRRLGAHGGTGSVDGLSGHEPRWSRLRCDHRGLEHG
jgi:hypothetical protein